MKQYLDLVRDIAQLGHLTDDRTGVGTRSLFGHQMRFNLAEGFPMVTTKRTFFKGVVAELLWFLRGETNIKFLVDNGVHIWDEWADARGELGPVYGAQWRNWQAVREQIDPENPQDYYVEPIDQIAELLHNLKNNPFSRRHIVSAWNPAVLPVEGRKHEDNVRLGRQALPPCHTLFQFHVRRDSERGYVLSCQLYQRSADVFLGVPFNIASYALLTHLIAKHLNYEVGDFVWTGGDCHLYSSHTEQVAELLTRSPLPLPTLKLDYPADKPLHELEISDIVLDGYESHPAIKAPVAV